SRDNQGSGHEHPDRRPAHPGLTLLSEIHPRPSGRAELDSARTLTHRDHCFWIRPEDGSTTAAGARAGSARSAAPPTTRVRRARTPLRSARATARCRRSTLGGCPPLARGAVPYRGRPPSFRTPCLAVQCDATSRRGRQLRVSGALGRRVLQAGLHAVRTRAYHRPMELLGQPLASCEFIVVDTETNGLGGQRCELTEVGAVLVGGGELHDHWSSLVRTSAPLRRGIQRFTGISQAMVDSAPSLELVLPQLGGRLVGRVLVAHNAPFDRRVLRQAFGRIGLEWPGPPVICTAARARTMLPLQRERRLTALADALGIEVRVAHRALADAETCARVLCALFPRLCANASTVAEALALLAPRRPRRTGTRKRTESVLDRPTLEFGELPRDPGVYLFRDAGGQTLYVGKSLSIRTRARAHFAPSAPPAQWTSHAAIVDYRATRSELGALVLENRLIKQLRPPGNVRLARRDDRLVYIPCRLDVPFPIREVAGDPAAGHGVTIGPLRGRRLAAELVEQLDSLFGLRHCGRRLPRREYPSAYGQMGRCLSPCLGDLDPNLYRRRLDEALRLFVGGGDGGRRLLEHVQAQM